MTGAPGGSALVLTRWFDGTKPRNHLRMPEPLIERIKTEVYFTDANGVEWEVVDARRRADGKMWRQYPGSEDAQLRYFIRYAPKNGATPKRALEIRRYRFADGESRWFVAEAWAEQLKQAERRREESGDDD